ncbi:hypothetical protein LAZ67_1002686 [Cordylochernes scorpioides]|uniref:RNA-directed DNA polymerase n=1 Tax=Cordylochernes scorpioides TaxID=51811 RepID=A0ABY6JWB8_9ARAC|nr:hypothetical protein LAZ67_1002686 [Cordylochernes scorpioides]
MTRLIAAQYYWDGMTNDIRTHVRTCSVCQLVKPPKGPIYGELGQLPPAVLPYELVSLDTISGFAKYGNSQTFLHVVVDHATRYAWAFPSRSTSILTYTQVIKKVMQFGSPKRLLTDRAPAFTSPKFRRFLIRHNIGQLLTTSNNPQANGLSERLNATITGKLKLLRLQQPKTAWTKLLPQVLQAYNHTPHSVTWFPPSYLLLGSFLLQLSEHVQNYPKIDDARELAYQRTHERHLRDKARFDQTHRASDFEVGDLVLAKTYHHPDTGKLAPFFSGPYEILEIISPQIVRINRSNRPLSIRAHRKSRTNVLAGSHTRTRRQLPAFCSKTSPGGATAGEKWCAYVVDDEESEVVRMRSGIFYQNSVVLMKKKAEVDAYREILNKMKVKDQHEIKKGETQMNLDRSKRELARFKEREDLTPELRHQKEELEVMIIETELKMRQEIRAMETLEFELALLKNEKDSNLLAI